MISDKLLMALAHAQSVTVLTGAGISAESGVPTFRDPDGLWARFKPEELANFDAFMKNPDLVWEWYSHRREVISSVKPNPGHYALVEMEAMFDDFTLVTQNVDNLHARAGSRNIVELHGNIERSYCVSCRRWYTDIEAPPSATGPICSCGGQIRPDVVWFGEMLPEDAIRTAMEAAGRADIFFSVGTSGEVYPAAQLPGIARQNGAYVVEINPGHTAISWQMTECLIGPSGEILPQVLDIIREQRGIQK